MTSRTTTRAATKAAGQELRDLPGGARSAREVLTGADQKRAAVLREWGEHA